jgi:hypothetical protein
MRRTFGIIALIFVGLVLMLRINPFVSVPKWFASKPKPKPDSALIPPKKAPEIPANAPAGTVLFEDDFSDNHQNWAERNEPQRRQSVRNGKYRMENLSEGEIYWSYHDIPLRDEDDFMAEASFTKIAGQDKNTFGLIWGCDDAKRLYAFGISDEGEYRVSRHTKDWENLINFKKSKHIVIPDGTNILRIEKRGFKLLLYINNYLVETLSHQALFGKGIGFCVNANIVVEVDNFVVKKL